MVDEGPCLIRFLKSPFAFTMAVPCCSSPQRAFLVHAAPPAVPCHGWDVVFWF
jgi:hypothetical protein